MSAVGLQCNKNEIKLFSDGYQGAVDSEAILSWNVKKIYTVNNHCAALNVGSYGDVVSAIVDAIRNELCSPEPFQLCEAIGAGLKAFFDKQNIEEPRDFLSLIVGYNSNGEPELWKLAYSTERAAEYGFTDRNPHDPEKQDFGIGTAFAIACGIPETDFKERLQHNTAEMAFSLMVADLQNQGVLCGGQIFQEVLTPSLVPEVSMDEMNAIFGKMNANNH